MEAIEVQIENLREALRQIQRSLTVGLGASLSLTLLQFSTPVPGSTQLPWPVVPVETAVAKLLLGVAHIVAGFMAFASLEEAGRIARLVKGKEMRDAVLSYPSIATNPGLGVRVLAWLLPPLFFISAIIRWAVTTTFDDRAGMVIFAVFAVCFGVLPYCAVAYRIPILIPSPAVDQGGTQPGDEQSRLEK